MKENSVSSFLLHHFLDNNAAKMLLLDKLSLKTLDVYTFIIFWPQIMSTIQFTWKKARKSRFLTKSFFQFFVISCCWNSKTLKCKEILYFQKHSSLRNWFWRRTLFFVPILEFQQTSCQLPKMKFWVISNKISLLSSALFASISWLNANFAMKYWLWFI